jgi:hypothetical protein
LTALPSKCLFFWPFHNTRQTSASNSSKPSSYFKSKSRPSKQRKTRMIERPTPSRIELLPAALAPVPFGFILAWVRVRVRIEYEDGPKSII